MFLITRKDFHDWAKTLPGRPKIHVHPDHPENIGVLILEYHKNHRRRFEKLDFQSRVSAGTEVKLKRVSHQRLQGQIADNG